MKKAGVISKQAKLIKQGVNEMKKTSLILFSVFALTAFFVATSSVVAEVRVAVTPFEVSPGLERYAPYARGELENLIMGFGNVEIVERARMDKMTQELSFGNFSGMTDPNQVAKFGKMAGANILVTGSLLKVDAESQGFKGFGIGAGSSKTVATIRVRAYNVEKGTVTYSTTVKGSSGSFQTSFGGAAKADDRSAAIEDAMKNLGQDANFKNMFAKVTGGESQSKVKIEVTPAPDRCDLEINGVYKGSTPAMIEVTQGVTVTIRLTKAGYLPWEKAVQGVPGMRISPELERKPN